MTMHRVSEDWLLDLETKIGALTKKGSLKNRLNEILSQADFIRQKAQEKQSYDTSVKKSTNFLRKIVEKLSIKRNE